MLVVFSGGSGVGKNTIIEKLLEDGGFELLPTYTTRAQRPNESFGKPYHFITEEQFKEKIEAGELFEYNIVHGNYYGTSKVLFDEKIKSGKVLLKDIDVQGTQELASTLGKMTKLLTFFLRVDSKEVLVQRLIERKEKEIEKRLARYELEQTYQTKYDYIITNNYLEETLGICRDIIAFSRSGAHLLSTQTHVDMKEEKIYQIAEAMKNGETEIPPISVRIKDHKLYIVDGHHRYLASLVAGKKIAAAIVDEGIIDMVPQPDWDSAVEYYSKQKV